MRRQLPHRAGGLRRRCAPVRRSSRHCVGTWRSATFYGACDVVLSPSPASDERLARARDRDRADRALGSRRRRRALRSGAARRRGCFRDAAQRPVRGTPDASEKGVDLLADAFLAARRARPAAAPGAGRRRPRGARLLRARLGDHATFLGWLRGDDLARAYCQRRRLPVREPDRHVRPGGPRGAGERAAGGRGRRGRADVADRPRRDRAAAARRTRTRWRAVAVARRRAAAPGRAGQRRAHRVRSRTWDAALARLAAGYRRALSDRGRATPLPRGRSRAGGVAGRPTPRLRSVTTAPRSRARAASPAAGSAARRPGRAVLGQRRVDRQCSTEARASMASVGRPRPGVRGTSMP